jgi:hypothetical protein
MVGAYGKSRVGAASARVARVGTKIKPRGSGGYDPLWTRGFRGDVAEVTMQFVDPSAATTGSVLGCSFRAACVLHGGVPDRSTSAES